MLNVYALIVCHLRTHPLRKSQNCVDFSVSLRTVILVSTDLVPGFTAILGVQSQIEEFLEIEKVNQNGISGIEGS